MINFDLFVVGRYQQAYLPYELVHRPRLTRRWDDAKLLHHTHRIPVKPAFLDLAVTQAMDVDGSDVDRFAGSRDTGKLSLLGAGGDGVAGGVAKAAAPAGKNQD